MDRLDVARAIEAAGYRSWRARECAEYDGWQLRYADGFSRRGNSVYPAEVSTVDIAEKLDWCRRWYLERELGLVIRQTEVTEPALDDVLAGEGFTLEGHTDVMTGSLDAPPGGLEVEDHPSLIWWRTTAQLWGFDSSRARGWGAIVSRVNLPAGFASVNGEAAGLAIVAGPWVGLFEIIVSAPRRRNGLGGAVTRSLLEWGRGQGASHAYLQVVADNAPAIAFYKSLGFAKEYSYWYRRDQVLPANRPA